MSNPRNNLNLTRETGSDIVEMPRATGTLDESRRRVAIVHDWLPLYGGAERVLEQILILYPDADLYSIVDFIPKDKRKFLLDKAVHTSFVQKMPGAKKYYRSYLPLMPLAIEQFDLSRYDLVISSSYAVAKGILTGPDQLHVCYCHSPIRYGWDLQSQYLEHVGARHKFTVWAARVLLHYIRMWDLRTSHGVNSFIANSAFVARRIKKVYGREARVIYPPVDTASFTLDANKENFYVTASRMVSYKKIDLIVDAFTKMPDKELIVIGDGPDFKSIKAKAGPNVKLLGYQENADFVGYMQRARAFIFAAEEDFGIVPIEAQACGTPVIAYARGGVAETVVSGETGIFFKEQTSACLQAAVRDFEHHRVGIHPERCRMNAERFSVARFRREFSAFLEREWIAFKSMTNSVNDV
jgi:glycosyltransferase involved in cell wall biosynthesis